MTENTKQRLLRKAADSISAQDLAAHLKVPQALLEAWISGHAAMPDRKFLLLADLLDGLSNPPK